jgi:hypothetical protein
VSEHFWLGFDRYLYLPVLMLSVPGARLWALVAERWPWRRSLLVVVAGAALLLSSASKFLTATHYESQEAFVASMARYRPEDPTASMFHLKALSGAEGDAVGEYLKATPFPDDAPALLVYMRSSYEFQANQVEEGVRRMNGALERDADNLYLRVLSLDVLFRARRFEDALALSAELLQNPVVCEHVTESLQEWRALPGFLPEGLWSELDRLIQGSVCAAVLREKARVYEEAK